jgi:hypothetical protein
VTLALGHAEPPAGGLILIETLKPSRTGLPSPSDTDGSERPWRANAASISQRFGVPFVRSPSSSSASSASA